jgi:hypothetical protein
MATRRSPPLDWNAPSDCQYHPQRVFHSSQLAARWQGGHLLIVGARWPLSVWIFAGTAVSP